MKYILDRLFLQVAGIANPENIPSVANWGVPLWEYAHVAVYIETYNDPDAKPGAKLVYEPI